MRFVFLLVLLGAGLFSAPFRLSAAPKRQIRASWLGGRRYLCLNDIAAFYGMKLSSNRQYCSIFNRWNNAVFTFQKRDGYINGTKVTWTGVPAAYGRLVYIADSDFFKMMDPVFRPDKLPLKAVRTILLDPGHGGNDKGASSVLKGCHEKDANLQMALRLYRLLRAKGFRVLLTRATDKTLTLAQRVAMAEQVKPDLFISIHCNSAPNASVSGIETFAATPVGVPGSSEKKLNLSPAAGNLYDSRNFLLAHGIESSLKGTTGLNDRGVKHARFYVIRNAPCPAVLIETGFLSNWRDSRILFSKNGQNAVANAIFRGILRYASAVRPVR